jgi:predicted  nucleic acid-binding Zn-ribbon protein
MKQWGLNSDWGMDGQQTGPNQSEVEQLKAQVAEMETTIDSMQERIAVLERLILDLDKETRESRLAAEIEKLRDRPEGGT